MLARGLRLPGSAHYVSPFRSRAQPTSIKGVARYCSGSASLYEITVSMSTASQHGKLFQFWTGSRPERRGRCFKARSEVEASRIELTRTVFRQG